MLTEKVQLYGWRRILLTISCNLWKMWNRNRYTFELSMSFYCYIFWIFKAYPWTNSWIFTWQKNLVMWITNTNVYFCGEKKSIKNKRIVRKLLRLTIVASSSLVTCICTVAVEAVPGLRAFTTMFTIIRQTPKMKKKEYVRSLFCSFTCHLYLWRDEKS